MSTDQSLELLRAGMIQGFLIPLGTAMVAGIASGIQEQLRAGIQSHSDRTSLHLQRERLETINELLTNEALPLSKQQRLNLEEELDLIATELQVLRQRQIRLKRSQADVLGWERLAHWRQVFTLPRPRNTQGLIATLLYAWFLYLSGLALIATYQLANVRGGAELLTFLLVMLSSVVLPLLIGLASRYFALRAARKRDIDAWKKKNRLVRAFTLPFPSTTAQLWPSLVWLGVVIWLGIWGIWVSLWLLWGAFHEEFSIELQIYSPEALIPGAALVAFFVIATIYSRSFVIIQAQKSIRSQQNADAASHRHSS